MKEEAQITPGDLDVNTEQDSPLVLALDDASATLERVGGKGSSLARLAAAGLPVPPGFHITTAAYRHFVVRHGLQEQILAAVSTTSPDQPTTFDVAAQTIATLFAQHSMPDEVASAIRQAYVRLGGGDLPVAVRSSATAEDLCRLTHKFAKTGRYASEEENGEDMCQIQAPISFREFKKIVWERAIRNSAS
jgi:phosphoenolpyruvate synthase/pyruvate phosphate dikinase